MAVNISVAGFITNEALAPIQAYVQVYFRQVNGGSSSSRWNTVVQTGADGYYSFNLGDGDFLTPTGNAGIGDQVLIAIWTGSDNVRLSANKTLFSYKTITLDGNDTIIPPTTNLITLADNVPVTSFSIPATIYQLTNTTLTNNSSDGSTDTGMEQRGVSSFGLTVFDPSLIGIGHVDWSVDSVVQTVITGSADAVVNLAQGTHHIDFTATDVLGNVGNVDHHATVQVIFRSPVVNSLTFSPASPTTDQSVTVTPSITDIDATIDGVDYALDGIVVQTNLSSSATWTYTFTVGTKTITQTVRWNDGFTDRTTVNTYTVVVAFPEADSRESELEAVNFMLRKIGEQPVANLTTALTTEAGIALTILRNTSRDVQADGWWFNEEVDYPLARDSITGFIAVNPNYIKCRVTNKAGVIQRGSRLYNADTRVYTFTGDLEAEVVLYLTWTDLPQTFRTYVTILAARIFQTDVLGSESLDRMMQDDEAKAWHLLMGEEVDQRGFSMSDSRLTKNRG
jgi:hypothetical protein